MGSKMKEIKMKQVAELIFPNFPTDVKKRIVSLYHNERSIYDSCNCSLDTFLDYDNEFNMQAGIYELDKSMKSLQQKLNMAIQNIADDKEVEIQF